MALLSLPDMAARRDLAGAAGLSPGQDWPALIRRRDAWAATLAARDAKRVALHFESAFAFTAALLGAWTSGCTAVIAGDATDLTTAGLEGSVDAFLGGFPARVSPLREPAPGASVTGKMRPFPATPVVIFTSGSTGKPVAIGKSASDLGNELATLEAALGGPGFGDRVLATVSHQHIYGLLFRCLWPLASGRPFADAMIRFPEELVEQAARPGALLVASPAFLKRLPEAPAVAETVNPLKAVFSSGGSLPWGAAMACKRMFETYPIEIYGSSETGGIAWRLRTEEAGAWTFFPGMRASLGPEGNLVLEASPHVGAGLPYASSDRVRLVENGLILLGRSDRIVKLEEKRLSLTAMEELLARHPRIAEARLVLLQEDRTTLGAVARLKGEAIPVRGTEARAALVNSLRDHLLQGFERVLLPKRWRFVEAMPANAAGKTVLADLEALFEPQPGPVILRERAGTEGAVLLDLAVPAELDHFQGHFPQLPLLPGVVQIDWAVRQGMRLFGPFGAFKGLQAVKFSRPIWPGLPVTLELSRLKGRRGFAFKYDSAEGRHAGGQALFEA